MKSFLVFLEDGSGAGGLGGAPTNVQAGLGSVVAPDGSKVTPPVFRSAQKKRQREGKKSEEKLGTDFTKMRREVS